MPVQTAHADYLNNLEMWQKCRTLEQGQAAVKAQGTKYLPKLEGQDEEMYNGYLNRAMFFNATGRTIDGMVGIAFRKQPQVIFPESKKDWLEKVGKEGTSFEAFAKATFRHIITVGRHGVLLDIEDSLDADQVPYLVGYTAESIINWRTRNINGEFQLSLVVLEEIEMISGNDEFELIPVTILRVLKMVPPPLEDIFNPEAQDWHYQVDIWQENPQAKREEDKFVLRETITPNIRGQFITYIPFVFFGPVEQSTVVQKSPINDLCDVNVSHYQSSADIEHGRHFTALPTAWVAGFQTDQKLVIGSQKAWVTEDPNAKAGFLEYTGQGLQAIETAMKSKEAMMAVLGARMLEEPQRAVEAADTHRQRRAGEVSVLAATSSITEGGFETILDWVMEWLGILKGEISVELNKDFIPEAMAPTMLTALLSLLQSGRMSWDTFIWNLERGELLPEGRTPEEELQLIELRPSIPDDKNNMDLDDEDDEDETNENEEEEPEE